MPRWAAPFWTAIVHGSCDDGGESPEWGNGMTPPTFDHRDAGTPEDRWPPALSAACPGRLNLSAFRQLVVLAAHPDDETLGAGGLLAAAYRLGLDVTVVIATLGEGSHPGSSTHTPDDLARVRQAEVRAAVRVLAPSARVWIVGLPDGRLTEHRDQLLVVVAGCVAGPTTLVVAPFVADRHPDHEAAGAVATQAAAAVGATPLGYPIWMWHWALPEELPGGLLRLDLESPDRDRKREALQCHRSQIHPLSDRPGDEPIVAPDFAAHFDRGYEIFVKARMQ
jgi:LmbE family N-acetylglucosaminyl deacetylase